MKVCDRLLQAQQQSKRFSKGFVFVIRHPFKVGAMHLDRLVQACWPPGD